MANEVGTAYEQAITGLKIGMRLGSSPSRHKIESEIDVLEEAGMEKEEIVRILASHFATSPEYGKREIDILQDIFTPNEPQPHEDVNDVEDLGDVF